MIVMVEVVVVVEVIHKCQSIIGIDYRVDLD